MIVSIQNKHFGSKNIFSDFRLELEKGKRTAILAPSGWGKTTLIRIASGLDKDFMGVVIDPPERPIILFQEDRLVSSLSVRANLKAVSADEDKALYYLEKLSLKNEYDSIISTLSGGMKRRVAIARALLMDYDWLFLDEPFEGLDPSSKREASNLIVSSSKGKGVVMITHDIEEARLLESKIIEF